MNNHKDILEQMKFKVIGAFYIEDNSFIVDCDEKYLQLEQMIYIHTIDGEIVRIGSSKNKLKSRMRSWERDVTKALNGLKSSTPLWESEKWREILNNKKGVLYGRQGTTIKTPAGEFNSYLSEESFLIGKFTPKMNRSKHR
jgi:hypothetical protein